MPTTKGKTWTEEEDRLLVEWQAKLGNKWAKIAVHIPGRNGQQCAQRWRHKANPNIVREKWTDEQDELLVQLVHQLGHHWADIARHFKGRTDQQCMGRWRRHLDPSIRKDAWTHEEDMQLIQLCETYGNRWSTISKLMVGRTAQQCRGHWQILKTRLPAWGGSTHGNSDEDEGEGSDFHSDGDDERAPSHLNAPSSPEASSDTTQRLDAAAAEDAAVQRGSRAASSRRTAQSAAASGATAQVVVDPPQPQAQPKARKGLMVRVGAAGSPRYVGSKGARRRATTEVAAAAPVDTAGAAEMRAADSAGAPGAAAVAATVHASSAATPAGSSTSGGGSLSSGDDGSSSPYQQRGPQVKGRGFVVIGRRCVAFPTRERTTRFRAPRAHVVVYPGRSPHGGARQQDQQQQQTQSDLWGNEPQQMPCSSAAAAVTGPLMPAALPPGKGPAGGEGRRPGYRSRRTMDAAARPGLAAAPIHLHGSISTPVQQGPTSGGASSLFGDQVVGVLDASCRDGDSSPWSLALSPELYQLLQPSLSVISTPSDCCTPLPRSMAAATASEAQRGAVGTKAQAAPHAAAAAPAAAGMVLMGSPIPSISSSPWSDLADISWSGLKEFNQYLDESFADGNTPTPLGSLHIDAPSLPAECAVKAQLDCTHVLATSAASAAETVRDPAAGATAKAEAVVGHPASLQLSEPCKAPWSEPLVAAACGKEWAQTTQAATPAAQRWAKATAGAQPSHSDAATLAYTQSAGMQAAASYSVHSHVQSGLYGHATYSNVSDPACQAGAYEVLLAGQQRLQQQQGKLQLQCTPATSAIATEELWPGAPLGSSVAAHQFAQVQSLPPTPCSTAPQHLQELWEQVQLQHQQQQWLSYVQQRHSLLAGSVWRDRRTSCAGETSHRHELLAQPLQPANAPQDQWKTGAQLQPSSGCHTVPLATTLAVQQGDVQGYASKALQQHPKEYAASAGYAAQLVATGTAPGAANMTAQGGLVGCQTRGVYSKGLPFPAIPRPHVGAARVVPQ